MLTRSDKDQRPRQLTGSIPLSLHDFKTRLNAHRHWLIFGLSLALTTLTLYFVFRGIDRHVLARLLTAQNGSLLAAAALLIVLQINLGGVRWGTVLSAMSCDRPPTLLSVQAVFYASTFFNCLPLGTVGGDIARVWLARRFSLSVRQIVLSVLLDRILVVAALIVLAVITLPSIAHPLAARTSLAGVAILLVGVAGVLLLQPIARVAGRWRDVWLISSFLRTAEELRRTLLLVSLPALLYALLAAACGALAAYCVSLSLGIDVGLTAMIAIMSFVAFATALPISLAGWGVREVSLVSLLSLLGIDREAALILSVEFGIINTLMSLPGGLIWLGLRHRSALADPAK
jgi:glycosyltransferase 2 family protein